MRSELPVATVPAQRAAWTGSAAGELTTAGTALQRAPQAAPVPTPTAGFPPAVPASPAIAELAAAPLRAEEGASAAREPGAQLRLGKLQQGLDYLDRLAAAMQQLKGGLSETLARQAPVSAALGAQVEQLRQTWSQRTRDAGGRVDGELQAAPEDGAARQRFKLRGLDLAVLQQGGKETLRLQLPGQPQDGGTSAKPMTIAVTLDGEGTQQQLQALTKALSPAGLTVQAQGTEIVFSVAESQWPALRDGLTLRGEGKRFPSGQPVRALLEPSPDALQPQRWDVQEAAGQRQALGQLLQAQPKVAQARARLHGQLEAAAPPSASMAPAQAEALAGALSGTLSGAEYSDVGALLPALRGMHRQRVRQLLA
ncbi:hypothetical protein [Mitsuaria sp. GD03876]|uniref:hypothetical protein n=1 Tax=Mitsuaria sp. GD03876 TaxID=2975399 RepID=UPI00244BBAC8|nr:hypothetical protein [Mitsuaria sp. GD03876]MDH0867906.1 hypothetical protein [Mitsuaria sp. GD03876]